MSLVNAAFSLIKKLKCKHLSLLVKFTGSHLEVLTAINSKVHSLFKITLFYSICKKAALHRKNFRETLPVLSCTTEKAVKAVPHNYILEESFFVQCTISKRILTI